jgi:DNA invertase Pin-like site-specific DNA recombinase
MGEKAQVRRYRGDVAELAGLRVALYLRASKDAGGMEKSVTDQGAEGAAWVEHVGARVVDPAYVDNGRSASRFATRERDAFVRLVADVEAGRIDVIWFWELSRSQRRLGVFAQLRDTCRERGVLWVVSGPVYDMSNYLDAAMLGYQAVGGEVEAEQISERVRRGQASSAAKGRPHGGNLYGYERLYHRRTKAFLEQRPDTRRRVTGRGVSYSPAEVVAVLMGEVKAGSSLKRLVRELEEAGIPSPHGGSTWNMSNIRSILLNRAYLGWRVSKGEVVARDCWPALVTEETFWPVTRVLTDPKRRERRAARASWLLSSFLRCGVCGGPMVGSRRSANSVRYQCVKRGCTIVPAAALDTYVSDLVVGWLTRAEALLAPRQDAQDETVVAAQAEAERLRAELEEWRQAAESGDVSPVAFGRVEGKLLGRIAEAEDRAQVLAVPAVLRDRIGTGAAAVWAGLDLEVRRQIISTVADIRVLPVHGRRGVPVPDRVAWEWRLGDPDTDPASGAATDARGAA